MNIFKNKRVRVTTALNATNRSRPLKGFVDVSRLNESQVTLSIEDRADTWIIVNAVISMCPVNPIKVIQLSDKESVMITCVSSGEFFCQLVGDATKLFEVTPEGDIVPVDTSQ